MAKEEKAEEEAVTKKRRKNPTNLWNIPLGSSYYEVSYMHREVVTQVVTSIKHGYVISASSDGIVKFWKRLPTTSTGETGEKCLEFVKSFTAHVGPVFSLCISHSGDTVVSVGASDNILKVYDVSTFDVTGMIKLQQSNNSEASAGGPAAVILGDHMVAVPSGTNGYIHVYSLSTLSSDPIDTIKLHASKITAMVYNHAQQCVLSADRKGSLEIWNATEGNLGSSSVQGISYSSKTETDLYDFMKKKSHALSIATSGTHYCFYGADHKVRIMAHSSGKILTKYDERSKVYDKTFAEHYQMDALEYGKRAATERELAQESTLFGNDDDEVLQKSYQALSVQFDPSGKYIIFPTCVGIKVIEWGRNKLTGIIGKADASSLRFVSVCLCSGDSKTNRQMQLARSGGSNMAKSEELEQQGKSDALLIVLAFQKRRMYVFSHNDITEQTDDNGADDVLLRRDVLNEAPDAEDRLMMMNSVVGQEENNKLGTEAILRTSVGDIHFKLFPHDAPRTVENFCGHSRNGYYDGVIFHRIIKGFMLQTGDPKGDGTGGGKNRALYLEESLESFILFCLHWFPSPIPWFRINLGWRI